MPHAVRSAIAPVHQEPRISAPMVSQLLAGHPVTLLEERDDWRRVRGDDGYEGWVHRGCLGPAARPVRLSLGCTVERAGARRALPLGAFVVEGEALVAGEAPPIEEASRRHPPSPAAVVDFARHHFAGTSYLWGGVTPWGADCSGMTQTVFRIHGLTLPRDAWQQGEWGRPGSPGIDAAPAGELLFFSDRPDRRITHVGIATGDGGMVHVALGRGGWADERLSPAGDDYGRALRERFLFARAWP